MNTLISVTNQEARLCRKGSLLVRMMWMMSVCVSKLSTNQPVWKTFALCAAACGVDTSKQSNT
jgi:hypothetical protein